MSEGLGIALSRVLIQHEPRLLECDMDATATAIVQVSNLLGCIMANVLALRPTDYEATLEMVMQDIRKSAQKTAAIARGYTANLTEH